MNQLVEKQAVIDILKRDAADGNCMTLIADSTARDIEALPTIEAEPIDIDAITKAHADIGYEQGYRDGCVEAESVKHGRWISKSRSIYLYCSDCGREKIIDSDNWSYCPNCGAKMEAEEAENGTY